jgi:hypothetical protein
MALASPAEVTLVMVRCRCRVRLATMLSSQVGDGAAEPAWPWHDVDAEQFKRQYCRVMLAMARSRRLGHDEM